MKIGIIGGTGIEKNFAADSLPRGIITSFSDKLVMLKEIIIKGTQVYFLSRHGEDHIVPPHEVNYRANILALKKIGVDAVIAFNAVGVLNPAIDLGWLATPDDLNTLFCYGRPETFFDGQIIKRKGKEVLMKATHVNMSSPFCPQIRDTIYKAAARLKIPTMSGGVVAVTNGPRFETAAEVKALQVMRCDYVSMTLHPEAALAREAGLHYASICFLTNYATGIKNARPDENEVYAMMEKMKAAVPDLITEIIANLPDTFDSKKCYCSYEFINELVELENS